MEVGGGPSRDLGDLVRNWIGGGKSDRSAADHARALLDHPLISDATHGVSAAARSDGIKRGLAAVLLASAAWQARVLTPLCRLEGDDQPAAVRWQSALDAFRSHRPPGRHVPSSPKAFQDAYQQGLYDWLATALERHGAAEPPLVLSGAEECYRAGLDLATRASVAEPGHIFFASLYGVSSRRPSSPEVDQDEAHSGLASALLRCVDRGWTIRQVLNIDSGEVMDGLARRSVDRAMAAWDIRTYVVRHGPPPIAPFVVRSRAVNGAILGVESGLAYQIGAGLLITDINSIDWIDRYCDDMWDEARLTLRSKNVAHEAGFDEAGAILAVAAPAWERLDRLV